MAREISTKKKIVFALIVLLVVCLGLEVVGIIHAHRREGSFSFLGQHTPLLDLSRIIGKPLREKNQERYQKVQASYFLFDATLGIRFKPSTWAVALEADEEGKPHIATQRRLAIDPYGFIALDQGLQGTGQRSRHLSHPGQRRTNHGRLGRVG